MQNFWVVPDVEALVVQRVLGLYGDSYLEFCATKLPSWVAPDRVPSRGIYFWLAGGYNRTRNRGALHLSQILAHYVGSDEEDVIRMAHRTDAFLCTPDGGEFGTGRVLTGPYSNPLPDHKAYLYRYTSQLELPTYAHVEPIGVTDG